MTIFQHHVRTLEVYYALHSVLLSKATCYKTAHTKIEASNMNNGFPFEKFLKNVTQEKNNNKNNILDDFFTSQKESNNSVNNDQKETLKEVENALFNIVKTNIDSAKYSTFVAGKLELRSFENNSAIFEAQTKFIQSNAENNLRHHFENGLEELFGTKCTVSFQMKSPSFSIESKTTQQDAEAKKSTPSFTLDLSQTSEDIKSHVESEYIQHMKQNESSYQTIDKTKTFDNFIVGPSNNLAFATACAVSESPGNKGKYPCLYIYSDSGLGKTHLLHAVANGINDRHPSLSICLISAREFMKELINAYKDKTLSDFQRKYSESVDVLMIDDIHELKNKTSTQEEFFHIFNFLHDKGKQLIFTSDKSPEKINGIEERIITRLQWGLGIDIQKPDIETRTAILKKKALELDFYIQDDVLTLIAGAIKTSIRELEGSLIKLQASAELMDVEIDVEIAKEILKLQNLENLTPATLESISKSTSQYFKIPLADLKSKSRSKEIVKARHIAWFLSKNLTTSTYKEIAKYYGNRDHSSVIHGVNKIAEQSKIDPTISRDILFLENNL